MYIARHIERVVSKMSDMFPTLVVTGPRQVGKTTLLQHVMPQASHTTLDRIDQLDAALTDPEQFLQAQSEPVIIDEIQYTPDLFRYIKVRVDENRSSKGRFF